METHQDELARLLTILADGPKEGLSIAEIQDVSLKQYDKEAKRFLGGWSMNQINGLLLGLGRQIEHKKARDKVTGSKVTRYWLRRND